MKSKITIDEAFGIVCKRLDDYDTFLQMVKMLREAQKEKDEKRIDVVEKAVDNWLKDNIC